MMLLPSRRDARMPRSESRWSWLETACGLMATEAARSVTHISPARTRAWSSRRRVSYASTLNTTARPPAWIGVSSGRSVRDDRLSQDLAVRAFFRDIGGSKYFTITRNSVIVASRQAWPAGNKGFPIRLPLREGNHLGG